ncbi:septum site-determining protein Ssd [Actinomadura scrupuli]|uniref:septum site-determining protein Ssd n=1 Tax=Actinomadura scrupuli TaxID=559629 RepID=UPI003D9852A8
MTTPVVLIVTADPWLSDRLLRLAAAADVAAGVARDLEQVRLAWHSVPLLLVGAELADRLYGSPRRPGVVLVASGEQGPEVYRQAIELGAQDVAVLPDREEWLAGRIAEAAEPADGRTTGLCVVGGRGGAGASALASVLGLVAMRRGLRTLLVDGDPLGGGLDLALGLERAEGARWPEFAGLRGRLSGSALAGSLPRTTVRRHRGPGELAVLSWHRGATEPIGAAAMRSVLRAAAGAFDLIVADLARQPGEAGMEALLAADATVLVVPAEVRATVAADRVAAGLRPYCHDLRLVVRGPAPDGLSAGAVAAALQLPLAGEVVGDRRIGTALERGDLRKVSRRGSLPELCGRLVDELPRPARAAA